MGPPLDVLHHDEGLPVLGRAAVEQPRDVLVLEGRQELTLGHESARGFGADLVHQLDRDALLVGLVGPRCEVHGAHSAAADLALQAVGTDRATFHRIVTRRSGCGQAHRRLPHFAFQGIHAADVREHRNEPAA